MLNPLTMLVLVYGFMLVEARRAARNERTQRRRGGIEPRGDVYAIMRVAYPGAFALMFGEAIWRSSVGGALYSSLTVGGAPPDPTMVTGLFVFAFAKALKWWAIVALGDCWTFRIVVVPGMRLVRSGPYRALSHPNYIAVVGELIGAGLALTAYATMPIAAIGFGVLILLRLRVERAVLANLVPERESPARA